VFTPQLLSHQLTFIIGYYNRCIHSRYGLLYGLGTGQLKLAVFTVRGQHDDDDDRQEEREIGDSEDREEELGDRGPEGSVST